MLCRCRRRWALRWECSGTSGALPCAPVSLAPPCPSPVPPRAHACPTLPVPAACASGPEGQAALHLAARQSGAVHLRAGAGGAAAGRLLLPPAGPHPALPGALAAAPQVATPPGAAGRGAAGLQHGPARRMQQGVGLAGCMLSGVAAAGEAALQVPPPYPCHPPPAIHLPAAHGKRRCRCMPTCLGWSPCCWPCPTRPCSLACGA